MDAALDFDFNDFPTGRENSQDEILLVKFSLKPRLDKTKTAEAGRPIYVDTEYIDIRIPGTGTGGVCRPARAKDRARFPRHYEAFKKRVELPTEGTLLSEWPAITRSQADQLAFMNIKTVEQLASLNDSYAGEIMGGFGLKQKAVSFLAYSKDMNDKVEKSELAEENSRLRGDIAELRQMVEALGVADSPAEQPEPEPAKSTRVKKEADKVSETPKRQRRRKATVT